jgi:hypothetical protein
LKSILPVSKGDSAATKFVIQQTNNLEMSLNLEDIRNGLIGTWKLSSFVSQARSQTGATGYPMGKDAKGYLIYTADGFMSAQIMAPAALKYTSESIYDPHTQEAADAARHYMAYCGPYEVMEVDGKPVVKHSVETCLFQSWTGSPQMRYCDLKGDELILRPLTPWVVNVSSESLRFQLGKLIANEK